MVKKVDSARVTHVSLTNAKQHLGELIKRCAYGGERFIIEFRGKPVAELHGFVGVGALAVAETAPAYRASSAVIAMAPHRITKAEQARQRGILERLTALRKEIEARVGTLPDSAELIREMREERDKQLLGLL